MAAFLPAVAEWLEGRDWAETLVFVPTTRAAARLRELLAARRAGILPEIMPLQGSAELAALMGIEAPECRDAWAVKGEIIHILKELGVPEGRRVVMAESLYTALNRLALYGVDEAALREAMPRELLGFWEVQATFLLAVMGRIEGLLPGACERDILLKTRDKLREPGCRWVGVAAGLLDSVPAGVEVLRGMVENGGFMLFPEYGNVSCGLADEMLKKVRQEGSIVRLGRGSGAAAVRQQAATDLWQEVELGALAVREAMEEGLRDIGVVCADPLMAKRVRHALGRWGIVAHDSAGRCADDSAGGRALLAALERAMPEWGGAVGSVADWRGRLEALGIEMDGPVAEALAKLDVVAGPLVAADYAALVRLALGSVRVAEGATHKGVVLMGPLEARLMDFDRVIVPQAVEGIWPAHGSDPWLSDAHLRALGMPEGALRERLAGAEFEGLVNGGSREVVVSWCPKLDGEDRVPSRFLAGCAVAEDNHLAAFLPALAERALPAAPEGLGVFSPQGAMWPGYWSASFVEALMACPYKAMGERVLKLEPPEPQVPTPDARVAGLVMHRWLEWAAKDIGSVTAERAAEAEATLMRLATRVLRDVPPVAARLLHLRMAKLSPALVAKWVENGRAVEGAERRVEKAVGAVTVRATVDRVERGDGGVVVLDYKTGAAPEWPEVARGAKPQLALEAWLLAAEEVTALEYWQLKGHGPSPLHVKRAAAGAKWDVAALTAPVADGLAQLVNAFAEGRPFPALPDMAGGGLEATGHCSYCPLAGVCRRQLAGEVDAGGAA